jgi:hypothetical protein
MVTKYKCGTPGCDLQDKPVPDIQTVRQPETGERICDLCRKPMKVAETINVSGGGSSGKRFTGRGKGKRR